MWERTAENVEYGMGHRGLAWVGAHTDRVPLHFATVPPGHGSEIADSRSHEDMRRADPQVHKVYGQGEAGDEVVQCGWQNLLMDWLQTDCVCNAIPGLICNCFNSIHPAKRRHCVSCKPHCTLHNTACSGPWHHREW